ncbi:MAG: 3'-5' exonuclease [Patescibacteria group bacterium]|nr:3'-5' exonuclease [Patescibacteria group bacterium]
MSKSTHRLLDRCLVFFDLETTGLDPLRHEIIEVAAVVARPPYFRAFGEFEIKIAPCHIETADPQALEINQYSKKRWRTAVELEHGLRIFNCFAASKLLAAYNVGFDMSFLIPALNKLNIKPKFDYHYLDVASIAYWELQGNPEVSGLGLTEMCEHFGIENKQPHYALSDAHATHKLFQALKALSK